jgi:hypothetical protein
MTRSSLRTLAASFGLAALACATPQGAGPAERVPETSAARARPEPDPACHGTVQGLLDRNALDRVTLEVAIDASGRGEIREVLAPALTPAAAVELQRAMVGCAWAPRPAGGRTELVTTTWVREQIGR